MVVGHTAALRDLQDFVQTRQIPYLGQWYSRIALQYLGIEITMNERVVRWADDGRYLIREIHTHGEHAQGFITGDDQSGVATPADDYNRYAAPTSTADVGTRSGPDAAPLVDS